MGSPNASVFPLPVSDAPIKLSPWTRAAGMPSDWTRVGVTKPWLWSSFTMGRHRPSFAHSLRSRSSALVPPPASPGRGVSAGSGLPGAESVFFFFFFFFFRG